MSFDPTSYMAGHMAGSSNSGVQRDVFQEYRENKARLREMKEQRPWEYEARRRRIFFVFVKAPLYLLASLCVFGAVSEALSRVLPWVRGMGWW